MTFVRNPRLAVRTVRKISLPGLHDPEIGAVRDHSCLCPRSTSTSDGFKNPIGFNQPCYEYRGLLLRECSNTIAKFVTVKKMADRTKNGHFLCFLHAVYPTLGTRAIFLDLWFSRPLVFSPLWDSMSFSNNSLSGYHAKVHTPPAIPVYDAQGNFCHQDHVAHRQHDTTLSTDTGVPFSATTTPFSVASWSHPHLSSA